MKAAKKEVSRRSPASAISFDVVEQGLLSDKVAWRRLIIQRSNGLTARPMKIEGVSGFNMRDLLSFFGYPLDYYNPSMIMTYAYNHRPSQDGRDSPVVRRLRLARRAVRKAMESTASMLGGWDEERRATVLQTATLYCFRESIDPSREEELRSVFRDLGELSLRQLTGSVFRGAPLIDIDLAAKILGGGLV